MFAKVFEQIFDSSIAEDWQVRIVFEDMLILSDVNGVVDKTPEAIARRTNVPIEIVLRGIAALETPDPKSRRTNEGGRRIVRLDKHRDWGWIIVNYDFYRSIASEEQRREKTRCRVQKLRKYRACNADVTQCNVMKRNGRVCNDFPSASASASLSSSLNGEGSGGGMPDGGWSQDHVLEIARLPMVALKLTWAKRYFDMRVKTGWVDGLNRPVARSEEALKADMRGWAVEEPTREAEREKRKSVAEGRYVRKQAMGRE